MRPDSGILCENGLSAASTREAASCGPPWNHHCNGGPDACQAIPITGETNEQAVRVDTCAHTRGVFALAQEPVSPVRPGLTLRQAIALFEEIELLGDDAMIRSPSDEAHEFGTDDGDDQSADLGKDKGNQDIRLTNQDFRQAMALSLGENSAKLSHERANDASSILVRQTDAEVVIDTGSFDTVILVEVTPPDDGGAREPLRAAISCTKSLLGPVLVWLVLRTQLVEARGARVRVQIFRRSTPEGRPQRTAHTSSGEELREACIAFLYKEALGWHDLWAARRASGMNRADRVSQFHDIVLPALEAVRADRMDLTEFRRTLGFAHWRVIDGYRKTMRSSRCLDRYPLDPVRELGWDETSSTRPPEAQLALQQDDAAEERMKSCLPGLLDELMRAKSKPMRDTAEYLQKCQRESSKPTGAGLAAYRRVDASTGSRLLKAIFAWLREKVSEHRDRPRS